MDEYLGQTIVNRCIHGGNAEADSESTVKETPTVLRKWFCTRMKSNDDGTKMTVFTLCTADFRTDGRIYDRRINVMPR